MGLPCFKTLDCWFIHFRVEKYLRSELDEADWEKVFNRPVKPKMFSLIELIEQAKKNRKEQA